MKTLLITLSLLFTLSQSPAITVWRFEWEDTSPDDPFFAQMNLPTETAEIGSGSIGHALQFPFIARDNGFDGFAPRTFTLDPLGLWTIFSGMVGWDDLTIYGDWYIQFGIDSSDYDMLLTGNSVTAAWNNSTFETHDGHWAAKGPFTIPDSGSTLALLGLGLAGLVAIRKMTSPAYF